MIEFSQLVCLANLGADSLDEGPGTGLAQIRSTLESVGVILTVLNY